MSNENNIHILGAGPAGLCAAINLSKAGKSVKVHEIRPDVGLRFPSNYQGFGSDNTGPEDYIKKFNVSPKFGYRQFSKLIICSRSARREVRLSNMSFVERGGKNSLEYGLYAEAKKIGVEFEFNTKKNEKNVRIVATGPKRCDAAAFGMKFENNSFPRDTIFMVFNDKYSPSGWYCYIIPDSKGLIHFTNCVSQPHVPMLKKLTFKAIEENKEIKEIIGGAKPFDFFGGVGGFDYPRTAVKDGRLYVGEAAGFQDTLMGYGIEFAMRSGQFAAESIISGADYDKMWKESFLKDLEYKIGLRFLTSAFGDMAPDMVISKLKDGETFQAERVQERTVLANKVLNKLLFRLELAKKSVTGYW